MIVYHTAVSTNNAKIVAYKALKKYVLLIIAYINVAPHL